MDILTSNKQGRQSVIGGKDRARFQKMDKERIKGIKRNRKSKG